MYEKLKSYYLPVDFLLKELYPPSVSIKACDCRKGDFAKVTLDWVSNPRLLFVARRYITQLLEDKEKYGYLYFLSGQPMLQPLVVQFKSDLFIESHERDRVVAVLEDLASEFAPRGGLLFNITLVELLYFFIRILNPSLTWLAVNSIIQCVKYHVHLLMSSHRPHSLKIKS